MGARRTVFRRPGSPCIGAGHIGARHMSFRSSAERASRGVATCAHVGRASYGACGGGAGDKGLARVSAT